MAKNAAKPIHHFYCSGYLGCSLFTLTSDWGRRWQHGRALTNLHQEETIINPGPDQEEAGEFSLALPGLQGHEDTGRTHEATAGGFLFPDSSPGCSFTKIPPSLAARPTCFSVSSEGGQGNGNILVSPLSSSSPRNCAALASHATCALLSTTMSKGTRQIYLSETIWNNRNDQHANSN